MTEPKLRDLPPEMRSEILADVRDELLLRAAEQIGLPSVAAAVRKMANLREHILNAPDLEEETVYVPGWDCTVLVRALTGAERAKFLEQVTAPKPGQPMQSARIDWGKYWADLVVLSARYPHEGDENPGGLIFSLTDRDALLAKSGKNLEVVASVARRLSGLEDEATANSKSDAEE